MASRIFTAPRCLLILAIFAGSVLFVVQWMAIQPSDTSSQVPGPGPGPGPRGRRHIVWPRPCGALDALLDRYFAPHAGGIFADQIDDALIRIPHNEASIVLFQVINNVIYVDKSRLDAVAWDTSRFTNLLERLKGYIAERRFYCQAVCSADADRRECERDFEFVADLKDCQTAWANRDHFTYANRTEKESLQRYSHLPIFTITKCIDRASIPVVQWYDGRDGRFLEYDARSRNFLDKAFTDVPDSRQKKAVFYGALQLMTTFTRDGSASQRITRDNWRKVGRSRLVYLGQQRPDLLEVGLKVYDSQEFGDEYAQINSFKHYPADAQARDFRYVIYAEGACGWADRLKTLLLYNATILLQNTSCSEYYRDLMEPYVHYIPVEGNFDDLLEKISWARQHDDKAADIARNALHLHQKYLTVASMRCYMNALFDRYSKLTRYVPKRRSGTQVEWQPNINQPRVIPNDIPLQ